MARAFASSIWASCAWASRSVSWVPSTSPAIDSTTHFDPLFSIIAPSLFG
jgi:hypothetical protein